MKNVISILMGSLLLFSLNASARTSAIIVGTEERPVALSVGAKLGMGGYSQSKDDHGMGMKDLSGHVGITHYIGSDFEYGVDLFGGWGTSLRGKLFGDDGKKDGFLAAGNLSARFMPMMSETVRLGGMMEVGYNRLMGDGNKLFYENSSFGDMSFNLGPVFSHRATDMFTWAFGLTYGMNDIRFGLKDTPAALKTYSNLHNIRLPINLLVDASDLVGVAFGTVVGWRHLAKHKFYEGLYYDVYADLIFKF